MTTEQVKEQLQTLAEDDYKAFNENLLPGVNHILGVRLPLLRKIAKEIAKTDCRVYLNEAAETIGAESFYEELMIQGLVIGYAKRLFLLPLLLLPQQLFLLLFLLP